MLREARLNKLSAFEATLKALTADALAQYACRHGRSAYYQRMPRLDEELRIRHGNGTFGKWLIQLAKTDVLLLDD